jgi:hypothetical protein
MHVEPIIVKLLRSVMSSMHQQIRANTPISAIKSPIITKKLTILRLGTENP